MNHAKFVKLWTQGHNAKVIAQKLRLSEAYVYSYASKHRDECPSRVKKISKAVNSDTDTVSKEAVTSTPESSPKKLTIEEILDESFKDVEIEDALENSNKEVEEYTTPVENVIDDFSFDTIIIDTSALADLRTFDIIERAKHVIISSVVLREINKLKDNINDLKLRHNFQKVLRECTLDAKNEKYTIANFSKQNTECNDEAIARNAAEIINAVVITRDYGLCCFCKLYNVKYLFISDETFLLEDNEVHIDNKDSRPFYLSREYGKLIITCLMGTIEILHGKKSFVLFPNEKSELFPGDHLTVKVKKESRFLVKNSKGKLILYPLV